LLAGYSGIVQCDGYAVYRKRHSEATLLIVRLRQMMLAESSGIVLHIWSKI
jgi:hypothetical protein